MISDNAFRLMSINTCVSIVHSNGVSPNIKEVRPDLTVCPLGTAAVTRTRSATCTNDVITLLPHINSTIIVNKL